MLLLLGAFLAADARPSAQSDRTEWRDIAYVTAATPDQQLDLTVPSRTGFPTVLFIHGGSLQQSGERRASPAYARVCEPFVAAGMGCATMDYRLAPAHRWPAMPLDVAAAFQWVKQNVGDHGGDPNRIFLFGHSSGCHLAAIVGANPKFLQAVGLTPGDVAGVIAMGCVLAPLEETLSTRSLDEFRAQWAARNRPDRTFATADEVIESDPSRFIGRHMPPTLIICAEAERFFPAILEQGAKFVRRLLEFDRPADLVIVPGRHMSSIQSITEPGDPTFRAAKAFIDDPKRR
jgi:acetyl esterase/lipase